jgi:hypothetical protein
MQWGRNETFKLDRLLTVTTTAERKEPRARGSLKSTCELE